MVRYFSRYWSCDEIEDNRRFKNKGTTFRKVITSKNAMQVHLKYGIKLSLQNYVFKKIFS